MNLDSIWVESIGWKVGDGYVEGAGVILYYCQTHACKVDEALLYVKRACKSFYHVRLMRPVNVKACEAEQVSSDM